MPSLTRTVQLTKSGIRWIGITFAGLIALTVLVNGIIAFVGFLFKPGPPPPTVTFGPVPAIQFLKNQASGPFTYSLNTASGTLPTFPNQARIYVITEPPPDLLSFDTVNAIVAQTEFAKIKAQTLSETDYSWSLPYLPFKRLTFNTLTYNYDLESQFYADPVVLTATYLPSLKDAIAQAQNFFDAMKSYPTDIDMNKTTTILLNIQGGLYYPASSLSTAQIIRVDFYQKDQNKLPIFYPNPPYSGISAIIASGKDRSTQIVEAHRNWQQITDTSSTYPLKTTEQAFSELKSGKAYIAAYTGLAKNIQINNVTLGYYVGASQQKYLMPIIVFQGNDGFYAYVSAVSDVWIQKK